MDTILSQSLQLVMQTDVLIALLAGGCFGLFLGAMPGLTATMALALLVPVTFFLDPIPALSLMVSAGSMAIFAGDIPGALLRIPGTPASAAYCEDAYHFTQQGKAEYGLGLGLAASVIGGVLGSILLAIGAPALARVALNFSSYEYFWLSCLGLTCAALVSQSTPVKGFISLLIGLLIATVGLDSTTGSPRFTFGVTELLGGIPFIPAMIGMFAVAELMTTILRGQESKNIVKQQTQGIKSSAASVKSSLIKQPGNVLRGGLIGTLVGALPGAGADIAAWISYAVARRFSKTPEKFGKGSEEGIISASSANNSSVAGGWIPTLVFGIPGDSGAAIIIGVLYLKGLAPGPTLFIQQPEVLYAVFITFFLANILLFVLGGVMIRLAKNVLSIPFAILAPLIMSFCVVGAFAMNNSFFGVYIMLGAGLVAWFMKDNDIPVAPAILGMVLGGMLERTFLTSMIKANGDLTMFFSRPIAATLGVITLLILLTQVISSLKPARNK